MASFLEKIKVKTAVERTHPITMTGSHFTTSNFMEFNNSKCIWMVPGKWKLHWKTQSLMEPMPQPTFGTIQYNNRAYFVPFKSIFKGWEDYLVDDLHTNGNNGSSMLSSTPYTTISEITSALKSLAMQVSDPTQGYTFTDTVNNQTVYYTFTLNKKPAWRLITALYGKIPTGTTNAHNVRVSMFPLLAATKVYLDYYYNNGYKNDATYASLKALCERDNNNLSYSATDIYNILNNCIHTFYSNNFFVDCWDNPNHPNITNQESTFTIPDNNGTFNVASATGTSTTTYNLGNKVTNPTGKDPVIQSQGSNANQGTEGQTEVTPITQYMLSMLRGLSAYLKRHQLAGGDATKRYLARYGFTPSHKDAKAIEMGHQEWEAQVTEIYSHSDTAAQGGEQLAAYAGVGHGDNTGYTYNIETNDFGIIFCVTTITPKIINVDGMDGMAFNLGRLDFWTPEFDNIGTEPISAIELKTSVLGTDPTNSAGSAYAQVFGFLPRYARWKTMRDSVSGDYADKKWESTMERYMLCRKVVDTISLNNLVHSKGYTIAEDAQQYLKIFYGAPEGKDDAYRDYFNIYHNFELEGESKMKPLYDVYEWEHEGGQEIEIQNNGPTHN